MGELVVAADFSAVDRHNHVAAFQTAAIRRPPDTVIDDFRVKDDSGRPVLFFVSDTENGGEGDEGQKDIGGRAGQGDGYSPPGCRGVEISFFGRYPVQLPLHSFTE